MHVIKTLIYNIYIHIIFYFTRKTEATLNKPFMGGKLYCYFTKQCKAIYNLWKIKCIELYSFEKIATVAFLKKEKKKELF